MAPIVRPPTNCFCRTKKTMRVGMAAIIAPAASRLTSVKYSPLRLFRAAVIGRFEPVLISTSAHRKSL